MKESKAWSTVGTETYAAYGPDAKSVAKALLKKVDDPVDIMLTVAFAEPGVYEGIMMVSNP